MKFGYYTRRITDSVHGTGDVYTLYTVYSETYFNVSGI